MSKLGFKVVHCTGEEDAFPVSELNHHTPDTRGYKTKGYCSYPQEIIVQLIDGECRITQLQILSHQNCISSKIELFVGHGPSFNQCKFTRLGYLSLSDNASSEYRARELKSVYVENTAQFIKLTLHKNHVNNLNIYSQVGIIAINVLGEPMQSNPVIPHQETRVGPSVSQRPSAKTTPMDDLAFDMHFDAETAAKIREIHAAKAKAVEDEDYDRAKQLKQMEESWKSVGIQIVRLDVQKKEAVAAEDYDRAKSIKVEIDKLKRTLNGQVSNMSMDNPPQHFVAPEPPMKVNPPNPVAIAPPASPQKASTASFPRNERVLDLPIEPDTDPMERPLGNSLMEQPTSARSVASVGSAPGSARSVEAEEFNESASNPNFQGIPGYKQLKDPEPLQMGQGAGQEMQGLIDLLGEFFTRCFYSNNWQHRDAAIYVATTKMNEFTQDDRFVFQQCCRLIQAGVTDRKAQVYQSGVKLLSTLLNRSGNMHPEDCYPMIESVVVSLISKLGDGQQRVRDTASAALLNVANSKCIESSYICTLLQRNPQKQTTQWKRLISSIQILREILRSEGLSQDAVSLSLDGLMSFVVASNAISHQRSDVRDAAKELTTELYLLVGSQVEPYLSKLRPRQLDEYQAAFEAASARGSVAAPQAAKAVAVPKRRVIEEKQQVEEEVVADEEVSDSDESVDEFTCQFCLLYDQSFTSDGLDVHYWGHCEMLTPCGQCEQVIEIACLNEHLLTECKYKSKNKECARCGEAINAEYYQDHQSRSDCPIKLPPDEANRCPLCHFDIGPGLRGWRDHLLREKCTRNSRSG